MILCFLSGNSVRHPYPIISYAFLRYTLAFPDIHWPSRSSTLALAFPTLPGLSTRPRLPGSKALPSNSSALHLKRPGWKWEGRTLYLPCQARRVKALTPKVLETGDVNRSMSKHRDFTISGYLIWCTQMNQGFDLSYAWKNLSVVNR